MEGRVDHGRGVTGPPGPAGPALALRVPGGAAAGSRPCRTELPLGPLLGRGPSGRPGDAPAVPAGPLRKAPVRVPRVRHPCGPRGASSCVSAPHRAADAGRPAGPAPARGLCPGTCCSRCGPHTASPKAGQKPSLSGRSPAPRSRTRESSRSRGVHRHAQVRGAPASETAPHSFRTSNDAFLGFRFTTGQVHS